MNIDTKKLLDALKSSNDKTVTLDKDFFIGIIESLDAITDTLKVEELFNLDKRYVYDDGNKTIINSGELLHKGSKYNTMSGEVLVEANELKALLKDNVRHRNMITELNNLNKRLEQQVRNVNDRIVTERRAMDTNKYYGNSLNQNIKVSILG